MVQPALSSSPVRHIERSVLRSFYHDPQYSDVTISFNGQRLHAHRFILACASKTFRTLFNTRTNTESEYPLMGYGSEAIHSMVKWIYGYDWDLDQDHSQYQQGAFYLDVWRLGLHFQLPLLVKKLDKTIAHVLLQTWESDQERFSCLFDLIIDNRSADDGVLMKKLAKFCSHYRSDFVALKCRSSWQRYEKFRKLLARQMKMTDWKDRVCEDCPCGRCFFGSWPAWFEETLSELGGSNIYFYEADSEDDEDVERSSLSYNLHGFRGWQ